ncbi:MAG: sigma-70 family RNA polymerase sigma factor [Aromatoleum sp.]|nr:sigma-70 family RNA polymerase sigma factor [Aromatoleum sp.]
MATGQRTARFEEQVLAHLDSAYNLARWITRDDAAARDAVQDGCLRAWRAFDQMQGPNPRAWFLAVIRNTCLDRVREDRQRAVEDEYDDELHAGAAPEDARPITPEDIAVRASDARWLRASIDALPREYREVIVLREIEELSYKEISAIVDIPIGTVMSRLARGRDLLQQRMRFAQERFRR